VQEQTATIRRAHRAASLRRRPQLTEPRGHGGPLQDPGKFGQISCGGDHASLVRPQTTSARSCWGPSSDVWGGSTRPHCPVPHLPAIGSVTAPVQQAVLGRMGDCPGAVPAAFRWVGARSPRTPYITASSQEVSETLFEAMLLVTLVVFIFRKLAGDRSSPSRRARLRHRQLFGMQAASVSRHLLTLFGLVFGNRHRGGDVDRRDRERQRIMAMPKGLARGGRGRAMRHVSRPADRRCVLVWARLRPRAFLRASRASCTGSSPHDRDRGSIRRDRGV